MSRSIIATASRSICRTSHAKRFYSVSRIIHQSASQNSQTRPRGNRTTHIDDETIDDNIVLEDLSQEGSFTYSNQTKRPDNQTILKSSEPTSEQPSEQISTQLNSSDQYDISNFDILPDLATRLKERFNITHLTPIQADVFNQAIIGKDIVARSKTGSGKTLAFLLPIIQSLRTNQLANPAEHCPRHREAKCLILQPTRELAMQTAVQVKKLIEQSNNQSGKLPIGEEITVAVVYGGTPYPKQELELARGVDILIATPGRLLDHMARKNVTLSATSHIVLDEADEMMRCGFVDDVLMILKHANSKKQMMLFSATLPKWVEAIIEKHVKPDREWIDHIDQSVSQSIDHSADITQTPTTIAHQAMSCPTDPNDRASLIASVIDNHLATTRNGRIIVFVSERVDAMFISSHPSMRVPSKAMTGEQAQTRRDAIMDGFRSGAFRVLVATDIAARGIDIPSVSLIIHAYFPEQSEAYVHRSGRTGRAGHAGTSLVLYQPKERAMIGVLSELIGAPIEHIYPPNPYTGKNQSVNQAIEKSISDLIEKHSSSLSTYTELSEKLLAEHGSKALSCLLAAVFHPQFSSRSLLTSSSAYTTVQLVNPSKGRPMTKDAIIQRLQYLIGRPDIGAGRVEHGDHVALVDLKNEAADELRLKLDQALKTNASNDQSVLPSSLDDVSFPSELPAELFTNQTSNAVRELKARWAAGKSRYGHTIKEVAENPDHRDRGPDARVPRGGNVRADRPSVNDNRGRQSRGYQQGRPGARSTENTRRRPRY